jgi:hypothetical protein
LAFIKKNYFMNKWLLHATTFFLFLQFSHSSWGQNDVFKGLFGKEAPTFHATVLPGDVEGTVGMVLYFTHNKLSDLEVSVWIKDNGPALNREGDKRLVRGLREMGNRRQDTIRISGLTNQHFYTVGVDYRNPKALSRSFDTEIVKENYRYEYTPPSPHQDEIRPRPPEVAEAVPPPQEKPSRTPVPAVSTCREANLSVAIEPSGFCQNNDRPAVRIQCTNCEGRSWDFSVEARAEYGDWRPLRTDGQPQAAFGTTLRTEPLCILSPGKYYLRVLAWGEGCKTPTFQVIGASILIPQEQPSSYAFVPTPRKAETQQARSILPDTCVVDGRAVLDGTLILGGLRLEAGSPCGDINPYAEVHYIHPGYRDLTINRAPLTPGQVTPFQFQLDKRDLARSVHPIEVIVYSDAEPSLKGVPLSSFWVNTGIEMQNTRSPEDHTPLTKAGTLEEYSYASRSYEEPSSTPGSYNGYASSLEETIDTIGVVASDPNCNGIQNLEMYYHRAEPDKPVFISWLSPRCCQRKGCEYTVWTGPNPEQLRLLVEGNKPGATVSELLRGLRPDDNYFEVVVTTSNGTRKAAYVMGEGPFYGYEEIIAYRDRLNPPTSDPLVFQKGSDKPDGAAGLEASNDERGQYSVNTSTEDSNKPKGAFAWNETPVNNNSTPARFQQPKLSIKAFDPCQYRRETEIVADRPIQAGKPVELSYNHDRAGYKYTLYYYAKDLGQWVVAPGTKELQSSATFSFQASPARSGSYIVLSYKPSKGWGCLSDPLDKPIKLIVEDD